MTIVIHPAELGFFSTLASGGSLSAAARELGITTPAVSKRLAQMEARIGLSLVNRTTRRMSLTPEGEVLLEHARRILADVDDLCASPKYLGQHGHPRVPHDLVRHSCIGIRQSDEAYGVWRLSTGRGSRQHAEAVKIRGNLTTNDGEIAVSWALDGHGILMRTEWDIERYLRSGRLVQVLPQYQTPGADIYAIYPQRHQLSNRIRMFVDLLSPSFERFGTHRG